MGGGGGGRFSFSTCNHVRRATRRLLLDKKDILSLGVHFTAVKYDDHLLTAVNGPVMRAAYIQNFLIHPVFVKGKTLDCWLWLRHSAPQPRSRGATQPGSDAVGRHSSFNMRDMFWATTTTKKKKATPVDSYLAEGTIRSTKLPVMRLSKALWRTQGVSK